MAPQGSRVRSGSGPTERTRRRRAAEGPAGTFAVVRDELACEAGGSAEPGGQHLERRTGAEAAVGVGSVRPRDLARALTVAAVLACACAWGAVRTPRRWRRGAADGLAGGFERLGPTFVKIGQLITSSPGAFPPALVAACQRHLDEVRSVPVDEIVAVIEADLGQPVRQLFASFDEVPLSAASIAQVHACRLLDGREAVVKVQRPGIADPMRRDLRVLHALARLVDRVVARTRSLNLPGLVTDLHRVTVRELDFANEAAAQERFGENLHAFGDNEQITVPTVYREWCGSKVLTMERLHGTPIARYAVTHPDPADRVEALRHVAKAWIEAVAVHGTFHGDLHGGNVWVLDDGRVAFLDFGIHATLPPGWSELVANLFYATSFDGGFEALARSTVAVGAIPADAGTEEEVGAALAVLAAPFLGTGIGEVPIGETLASVVKAFEQFGAKVPDELLLVSKQLVYLEGYTKALAPDHDLLGDPTIFVNLFGDDHAAHRW